MVKNYAVLLRCPHQDEDTWVVLQDRSETLEQVLAVPWDFECSVHGVQREIPVAANDKGPPVVSSPERPKKLREVASGTKKRSGVRLYLRVPVQVYGWVQSKGAFHEETFTMVVNSGGCLVVLSARVGLGDMLFVVNKATNQELECRVAYVEQELQDRAKVGLAFKAPMECFWQVIRQKPRLAKVIRVWVRGVDQKGDPFVQSAYTIDISEKGARLDGAGTITRPGETIEVKRLWRKARYRVVWVGPPGTPQASQVGICCLEGKNIWGVEVPTEKPKS